MQRRALINAFFLATFALFGCSAEAHSPWIFRIKAVECLHPTDERYFTGFKLIHQSGIYTAYHAVAGCHRITALPSDSGISIQDLKIKSVDFCP
jgi:hypothetical protein